MKFKDQWVWITGASSGIGKALAIEFSNEGAHLILSSRKKNDLAEVGKLCTGPGRTEIVTLDLADEESLDKAYSEVENYTPSIDVLVNNGGISQRALALDTDMDVTRRIMEVNFLGAVNLSKKVLPGMIKKQSGNILVTSSVVGKFGSPWRSSYAASKHALHGYFDSLRFEHEEDGINVTLMCPGYVKTDVSINAVKGDGSKNASMDENQAHGMSPETVARKAVNAVYRSKKEVYFGGKEVLAIYLKRYIPSLFRFAIRRSRVAE